MREYDRPLEVGDEIKDGRDRYRIVRVEEPQTRRGFRHGWAEHTNPPGGRPSAPKNFYLSLAVRSHSQGLNMRVAE